MTDHDAAALAELLSACQFRKARLVIYEGRPSLEFIRSVPESPGPPTTQGGLILPDRPEGAPNWWRWLSPIEERVVTFLRGRDWTSCAEIARAVGENAEGDLRIIIRNLRDRGIIEVVQGKGSRLREVA